MISGPNQVEIGSKSGPNQIRAEGFGWVSAGGVDPAGRVPVAPPESLYPMDPQAWLCPKLGDIARSPAIRENIRQLTLAVAI